MQTPQGTGLVWAHPQGSSAQTPFSALLALLVVLLTSTLQPPTSSNPCLCFVFSQPQAQPQSVSEQESSLCKHAFESFSLAHGLLVFLLGLCFCFVVDWRVKQIGHYIKNSQFNTVRYF